MLLYVVPSDTRRELAARHVVHFFRKHMSHRSVSPNSVVARASKKELAESCVCRFFRKFRHCLPQVSDAVAGNPSANT